MIPEKYRMKGAASPNFKHGHSLKGQMSPTYKIWAGMIQRCTNPSRPYYEHYGGRGITVCERWMNFENFLADMGARPAGLTIDRIDNDGNYCPENCRWATPSEQVNNSRANKWITHNGITDTQTNWARRLGMAPESLKHRLKVGIPLDAPLRPDRRRKHGPFMQG